MQELLAIFVGGFSLEYAAGIGPEGNFISLRASVNSVQLDDQLPSSRSPCLFLSKTLELTYLQLIEAAVI